MILEIGAVLLPVRWRTVAVLFVEGGGVDGWVAGGLTSHADDAGGLAAVARIQGAAQLIISLQEGILLIDN